MLLGVVSDTHGYLNPRVPELLRDVEHILHAGDVGDARIIDELSGIAPVTAVRGNNDRTGPASFYPEKVTLKLAAHQGSAIMIDIATWCEKELWSYLFTSLVVGLQFCQ